MIINAIETDEPAVIYVNVRNVDLVPNLPAHACVEVPCRVDGTGVSPVPVPDGPAELAALNRKFLTRLARQAAMLNPNGVATLTFDEIGPLCDELTLATAT